MASKEKQFTKAFISGQPIWATITQGNLHVERRCYENSEDSGAGVYWVKANGLWVSTEELKRMGDTVQIWF